MQIERRTHRSNLIGHALKLQLAASAHRAHLTSLVLGNEEGLLLADAGNAEDAQELAARLPSLIQEERFWQGEIQTDTGSREVIATRIATEYGPVYLCAVGGRSFGTRWEMLHSGLGVRRILS